MVKEFGFINLYRASAAFWVLLAHCMIWGGWYGIPLPSAKIAVDLFMIISGFLMAANAHARNHFEPLTTSKNWFRFWLRRFFRLAPAYYVSLVIAILTSSYFLAGYGELQSLNPERWSTGGVYDPERIEYTFTNIILHLSFLFGLHPEYSFSTFLPDWSLSLEMQFYFVFPALLFLMHKVGFCRAIFIIGLPVFVIGFIISYYFHYFEPSLLFLKLNYFMAGILLFRILGACKSNRNRLLLTLGAVFLVSLEFNIYENETLVLPFLLVSMLILGYLEAVGRTPTWLLSLVNSRVTRFASDTSYGVYLFHGFYISLSGLIISWNTELLALLPYQRVLAIFIFVTMSAYLTSYVIFRTIELPGIRFGKYVINSVAANNPKLPNSASGEMQYNKVNPADGKNAAADLRR